MRRASGIAFGLATHGLFACTVWHLFWFLKGPAVPDGGAARWQTILADAALAAAFAVPHSLLLVPAVRRRIVAAGVAQETATAPESIRSAVAMARRVARSSMNAAGV